MKIYRWIDKYNRKNSFKLIRKYDFGVQSGRSKLFFLHTSFWLKYLLRLTLVLLSIISFKKSTYKTFYRLISTPFSYLKSPSSSNLALLKMSDVIATIFGFRYFLDSNTLPLYNTATLKRKKLAFNASNQPLVSIIIPVFNHIDFTFNCLQSLKNHIPKSISLQIIVIDDCSTDYTHDFFLKNVSGITYLRNEQNLGFLASCNAAANIATGKYVCFLNNDIQVKPGWIENLLLSFKKDNVGLVGSKLVYANGMLQEAGGMVFNDGNAANFGRYDEVNHPKYNYAREVDYCSGASIMILKDDLEKLNYFDTRYVPAYYEDTDLCFSVRHELHKKVIYQPLSEVIHFEGISSGTDIEKHPVKKFQAINKEKFKTKWANELVAYPNKNNFEEALKKYTKKKILIIDDTIPEPDKDSGSVRLSEIIKILNDFGHQVVFLPDDGKKKEKYTELLTRNGIEVLHKYPNRKGMLAMVMRQLDTIDLIWICKPNNYSAFSNLATSKQKVIYDTIDLHFLRMSREADLLQSEELKQAAEEMKAKEMEFARKSELTIAITNDEKEIINNEGIEKVMVVPNIHETVSDTSSFKPFNERSGLLFIGGYIHKPNVDAAKWLVKEIMPIVWQKSPSLTLTLLGSNPNEEVLSLQSEKVIVPGYIEDVSAYFNESKLFVAPLRFGAGMKGKIGQSLSYGLPIVTTPIGAEGMSLQPNRHYLLATTTEEFAQQILALNENEELWSQLSFNSFEHVAKFHPDVIREKLLNAIESLSQ